MALPYLGEADDSYNAYWDVMNGNARVITYDFERNVWVGSFSFSPDTMAVLNNKLYTMKGNNPWCHDVDAGICSFYGDEFPGLIMLNINGGNFDQIKAWNTIAVLGNMAPSFVQAESFTPYRQRTTLYFDEFRDIEGKFYTSFRRNQIHDILSEEDALFEGEKMRGQNLYVLLQYDGINDTPTKQHRVYINSIIFGFNSSLGQTV